jgi:hypothetical protein
MSRSQRRKRPPNCFVPLRSQYLCGPSCCNCRFDDGEREEDFRSDGREDDHGQVLDATRLGHQHHQQGAQGESHPERPRRANYAARTVRHQTPTRITHRLRHRLRAPRLHAGQNNTLSNN